MTTIVTRASKGSALTWTDGDNNLINLNNDKIENVVEDTTPQLGGNLDVNGNSIVSVSNGNIAITPNGTGKIVLDGLNWPTADGSANQVLKTDGAGNLSFTTVSSGGISNVVEDTTPQLGGNLDLNGFKITNASGTNEIITIEPALIGTEVQIKSTNVTVGKIGSTAQCNLSTADAANLRLRVNDNAGGQANIVLFSGTDGNITINPNGTGQTRVKNLQYYENVYSLGTTSGTIAPNVTNGNVQTITLNGNLTLNAFTSPVAGQSLTLIINTNGTGRTLTSTMKFSGGSKTLSTTSTIDIISVFYDGTNYWASLSKDFK